MRSAVSLLTRQDRKLLFTPLIHVLGKVCMCESVSGPRGGNILSAAIWAALEKRPRWRKEQSDNRAAFM